ncbi:MAG: thioredoxin family protein [Sandaracinus sp.]|nr:thioredoxin family protein [Sandaracinus sp.]
MAKRETTMSTVQVVTDATFEAEVMNEALPVLVDLYADWCGPCRQMAPVMAQLAQELAGRAKVVKIDVDRNPMCAQMFRASSIPMFVAMHRGKVVGHQMGAVPKSALLGLLEKVIGPDDAEVEPEELARQLVSGKAEAIDVRDPGSYGRFRIPGAKNLPAGDLDTRKEELRGGPKVPVLYGRADEASSIARQLRSEGFLVRYLKGGFLAWEAEDLEVER